MMDDYFFGFPQMVGQDGEYWAGFFIIWILLAIWSLVWKGFALYKSSRRGDVVWFIILLIINTFGILELLYLFFFSEPKGLLRDTSNTVKGAKDKESKGPGTTSGT